MNNDGRKYIVGLIIIVIGIVFFARLFYMQVIDDSSKKMATIYTEKEIVLRPGRGTIFDRNGRILVTNMPIYDLKVIPNEILEMDTLAFCELTGITKEEFDKKLAKATKYASYKASDFIRKIPPSEYAAISEKLHNYPGFFGTPSTMRFYPDKSGALLLGSVSEVWPNEIENDDYYKSGDDIGKGGIEKAYEKELRGEKGVKYMYVNNLGILQKVADTKLDKPVVKGTDLISSIDAELQAYGEALMQNKKGCVVAIEPSTGEILSMVSSPTYDPNLLVGRHYGDNYNVLVKDSLAPLYNRAIQGQYRPGSIFKMVQSLVALQEGIIKPTTRIPCNRNIIGCHGSHSYDDLEGAIHHSCNPYFRQVMKMMVERKVEKSRFKDARLGLESWQKNIMKFGFGSDLGADIPRIKKGSVPGVQYYNKLYGGELTWAFSTIYSLSIGEGELLINPLQMANLAAIIANKGWYISPHTIKAIGDDVNEQYTKKNYVGVDEQHFDVVADAMDKVVNTDGGTARRARIPNITVCGKTGTVQNGDLPDHSVFIAYAPKDDPKIAIAVYVEFAGYGGTWAAPISSLMIEKYLTDSISDKKKEERMLNGVILDY